MKKQKSAEFSKLVLCIALPLVAGVIGSFFTTPSIPGWYAGLQKPWFNPPSWIFGPVWTALYILMGISLYLVWRKGLDRKAAFLFGSQLFLNILWSAIFFGLKAPRYALAEIALLWVAIALTIIEFRKISRTAALLLVPYILWVMFAAALNYYIFVLNL